MSFDLDKNYIFEIKARMKNIIIAQSLSCNRCNTLSAPILENGLLLVTIGYRYRCLRCGRQFSGSKYRMDFSGINTIGMRRLNIFEILGRKPENTIPLKYLEKCYEECITELGKAQ